MLVVSRREKQRKESLAALANVAYSAGKAAPPPPPQQAPTRPKPAPQPPKPRAPEPTSVRDPAAERLRRKRLEERRAKIEEERKLRQRREGELARAQNLQWRGMSNDGVPVGVRRTAFDRVEPTVARKLQDVLGDPVEKEGRVKNRERGRRTGGGRGK